MSAKEKALPSNLLRFWLAAAHQNWFSPKVLICCSLFVRVVFPLRSSFDCRSDRQLVFLAILFSEVLGIQQRHETDSAFAEFSHRSFLLMRDSTYMMFIIWEIVHCHWDGNSVSSASFVFCRISAYLWDPGFRTAAVTCDRLSYAVTRDRLILLYARFRR